MGEAYHVVRGKKFSFLKQHVHGHCSTEIQNQDCDEEAGGYQTPQNYYPCYRAYSLEYLKFGEPAIVYDMQYHRHYSVAP